MRKMKVDSRALRQLAEQLLDEIAGDEDVPDDEREDFVTSLVRQWVTYDGCASVFFDEEQFYLVLRQPPLGKPCVMAEPAPPGWLSELTREWKLSPDDLPDVLDQLNRGQSAEVVNSEGLPLRLWVNPRERSRGVEPLAQADSRPGEKRDYCKIAAGELWRQFGSGLASQERDALARSLAGQWQRHEGHASLFLGGRQELHFTLHEHGDGACEVVATRTAVDLNAALLSAGFPPEVVPELIARINLDQEIDFRDGRGIRCRLWHDPKARRIGVRPVDGTPSVAPPQAPPSLTPPALCPNCTGVLRPWEEGERQQTCAHCGQTVSLPRQPAVQPHETLPVFCPNCTGVLMPWGEGQRQQTCSHCGHTISLG
jgi:hypothetical protein